MRSIIHRFNRIRELGARNSLISVHNKIVRNIFYTRWRSKAQARIAGHTWSVIVCNHRVDKTFSEYWHSASLKSLPTLLQNDLNTIIAQAHHYAHNEFDILGSEPYLFDHISWHQDICLKLRNPQADYQFDTQSFYQDIKIETNTSSDASKDIKVPWELSRCHHLPILGIAYTVNRDEHYLQAFTNHIQSWIEHNPYLLGINWVCPMEVAIRAINWIWAWQYFKDCAEIPISFWEQFTCSLYDHMHYLENNWEIFDTKTSNHYLSDLLGYLYLCWFLQDLPGMNKKRDWCLKELLKEFERQVFEEGTDYESTTAYHCLVTEIFDHMALLCNTMDIELPDSFHKKLERMHEFIAWCTINDTDMVKIGDDDSGRVVKISPSFVTFFAQAKNTQDERDKKISPSTLFRPPVNNKNNNSESARPECFAQQNVTKDNQGSTGRRDDYKHYSSFGLSILKTNNWHITLRHHAYTKQQPSAHFHNDALSITLAIDGIPIIIDPGSYLYTASSYWRNYFRSVQAHNTFYIQGHEPIPFDDRLFALNIVENIDSSFVTNCLRQFTQDEREKKYLPKKLTENSGKIEHKKSCEYNKMNAHPFARPECFCESKNVTKGHSISLSSSHNLYSRFNLAMQRKIDWNDEKIIITDSWLGKTTHDLMLEWNFTFHPAIEITQANNRWILSHNNKPLVALESTLNFQPYQAWVSPEYGVKQKSICLKATYASSLGNKSTITFMKQ